jgi:diaminohydroxyphosphoribosylaminopyrimidine deaminase/5-amino-6-(5-phosphoribosylamino)uracil reductase
MLIEEGFSRVIIPHRDPNPNVSGDGVRLLKRAGIKVTNGILPDEAADLNQVYIKNQTKVLPYVSVKVAMTFDGQMADANGTSKWITGDKARSEVHDLRLKCDALAVGAKTIDKDNPSLNARPPRGKFQPRKVVIFGRPKKLSLRSKVIKANGPGNVIVVTESAKSNTRWTELNPAKTLKGTLKKLYMQHGICHLLVEGGPRLASSFLGDGVTDELVIYLGKGILGGSGKFRLGNS